MNVNDLKKNWVADTAKDKPLPAINLLAQRSYSAVNGIRKKMKRAFIVHLAIYIVLLATLFWWFVEPAAVIACVAVIILILIAIPYWLRFYFLYQRLGRYDMRLKKSIRTITYEIELNVEIYKTYLFSSSALWVFIVFVLLRWEAVTGFIKAIAMARYLKLPWPLIGTGFLLLILTGATCFIIHLSINFQYGQYLKELRKLTDELEQEE